MSRFFKSFLFEPIVLYKYLLKFICIFIIIFSFLILFFSINAESPKIFNDTPGYFQGEIKYPWSTYRTPGLRIYATMIGVDIVNNIDKDTLDINELNKIVHANILLYAITISLLFCTLCKIIPPFYIIILLIIFGCEITKIPSPSNILADPLAFILSVAFLNSCIEFYRKNSLILLFLICLLAIFGFLTKPACCFMPMIATVMCIYELFCKNNKGLIVKFILFIFLIAGTLSWPFWIYINGGIFVTSQLSAIHKSIFALHFMSDGDEDMFSDNIDKQFILRLMEEKKKALQGNTNNSIITYLHMRNAYGYHMFGRIMNEVYGKEFTLYERAVFCKKICSPIIKKHRYEYIIHIRDSIKLSFTILASHTAIFIWKKLNSIFFLKYWRDISIFFIIIGISVGLLSNKKNYNIDIINISRIICISVMIHLCHIVVTSIGHFVTHRYAEITEWSFVLGVYLSIYNFLYFFTQNVIEFLKKKRDRIK